MDVAGEAHQVARLAAAKEVVDQLRRELIPWAARGIGNAHPLIATAWQGVAIAAKALDILGADEGVCLIPASDRAEAYRDLLALADAVSAAVHRAAPELQG